MHHWLIRGISLREDVRIRQDYRDSGSSVGMLNCVTLMNDPSNDFQVVLLSMDSFYKSLSPDQIAAAHRKYVFTRLTIPGFFQTSHHYAYKSVSMTLIIQMPLTLMHCTRPS